MTPIIQFKSNNFGYNNTNCFNDFNMTINEGDIVTLIGTSGSGKTTLLKMLCNKLPNDSIYYYGIKINEHDMNDLKKEIAICLNDDFYEKNILNELKHFMKILNIPENDINEKVNNYINEFNLQEYIDLDLKFIPYKVLSLVKILRLLIITPKFMAIDSLFSNLDDTMKNKIIKIIKDNKITLLNVTNNLNDALRGNKLAVLENFVLILEGSTLSVLKTDTLLKRLGFTTPLTVDLSIELIHYDIINKVYTDNKKLVGALWK